ncbi:hypothetical protein OC835_000189 [Tilletia horrida]|nr:hypothetical protein OC835_000189 [Tilletia horrida]
MAASVSGQSRSGQSWAGGSQRSTSTRSRMSAGPGATLSAYALEALLSISAAPPRLPTQKRKVGLNLAVMTMNLRAFTQKSTPVFWFQDNVEATLTWDDPAWTVFCMGVYALVVLYPLRLIPAGAPALLVYILIQTHNARFPDFPRSQARPGGANAPAASKKGAAPPAALSKIISPAEALRIATEDPVRHPPSERKAQSPITPELPHEGSMQYYENVRDIQNMMALIAKGYDDISPIMPFINWSSYNFTLVLMQVGIVATVAMFFLGPYIPLQPVLLIGGEALFILTHPYFHPAATTIARKIGESEEGKLMARKNRALLSKVQELLDLDRLSDDVWERGWKNVEMFENQRWMPLSATAAHRVTSSSEGGEAVEGTWSGHNLRQGDRRPWTKGQDGWTAAASETPSRAGWSVDVEKVDMSPGDGWTWVDGDDWRIDWVGAWSEVGADEEGFVYTDSSWQRPAPVPYGHPSAITEPALDDLEENATFQDDAASELTVGAPQKRFSKRQALYDALAGVGLVSGSGSEAAIPAGPVMAETRRRRWLRRAVRVA